ncbi:MAG: hydrogenase expression protein [Chloroflexi bacterium]|nr:hydrogenase expression protein [Chloroflexota bacterium]
MKPGKLPAGTLARLLSKIPRNDPRVIVGPGIGEDAAVIEFRPANLIAKTDPITFASDLIGWYAVQVNANDVAASGGTPRWFMATVLLPEGSPPELPERIFQQIQDAAASLDLALIGGHTEITIGIQRPIVVGVMLGEVAQGAHVSTAGARPGDRLVLTKGIAVEGTAVLARECRDRLIRKGVSQATVDRAAKYLHEPGISVVRDAEIAMSAGEVHSMHDPTEGGLATAIAEVAAASGNGLRIDAMGVRVLPETDAVCRALGIDPWGLLASGALLIAASPAASTAIVEALNGAGIPTADIGEVTGPGAPLEIVSRGRVSELPRFDRDEVARVLESA